MDGTPLDPDPLNNDSQILGLLATAARRIRMQRAAVGTVRAALIALAVLIPVLALRDVVLPVNLGWCLLVLLVALTAGGLFGLLTPLSLLDVARQLDDRMSLEERLQSALEFRDRLDLSIVRALVKDASDGAATIQPAKAFPLRPPPESRHLVPYLALAAAVIWLPLSPIHLPGGASLTDTAETSEPAATSVATGADRSEEAGKKIAGDAKDVARHQPVEDVTAAYRDSPFAPEPPDFTSFLQGANDRLSPLGPASELPDLRHDYSQDAHLVSVRRLPEAPMKHIAKHRSGVEAAEQAMEPGPLSGSGDPDELDAKGQLAGGFWSPRTRREADKEISEQQQGGESQGSPGATSARQTQSPDRTTEIPRETVEPNSRSYGGGEQPHDAPGGILPSWLQGPEDPRFQDAGLGNVEAAGKKSGQPGTGHAPRIKGAEAARLAVPKETDIRLSGQQREGDWESYDSGLLGPGVSARSRLVFSAVRPHHSRMAEETLSRERVPLAYREQVKRYFSAIEGYR